MKIHLMNFFYKHLKDRFIEEYKSKISNYLKTKNILVVSSGTTGLILSHKVLVLGIGN